MGFVMPDSNSMGFTMNVSLNELLGNYKAAAKEAAQELRALEKEANRAAKRGTPWGSSDLARIDDLRQRVDGLKEKAKADTRTLDKKVSDRMAGIEKSVGIVARVASGQVAGLGMDLAHATPGLAQSLARAIAARSVAGGIGERIAMGIQRGGAAFGTALKVGGIAAAGAYVVDKALDVMAERDRTREREAMARGESSDFVRRMVQREMYGTRYNIRDIERMLSQGEEAAQARGGARGIQESIKQYFGMLPEDTERREAARRQEIQVREFNRQRRNEVQDLETLRNRSDVRHETYRQYYRESRYLGAAYYAMDWLTGAFDKRVEDTAARYQAGQMTGAKESEAALQEIRTSDPRYRVQKQQRDRWLGSIEAYDFNKFLQWSAY
jgi:hypothetical protein